MNLMERLAKITAIATPIVAVIVLGAAWLLAAPKGELRLALSPSVQNDAKLSELAAPKIGLRLFAAPWLKQFRCI